jgi:hypothetical protein
MRREQMDSVSRYIYLFRSFLSVVPQLQFWYWAPFWRSRRRRFFRFVFLRKRIHAKVFKSSIRFTSRVVDRRMTHDDSVQIAASAHARARHNTVGDLADSRHRTPAARSRGSALRPDGKLSALQRLEKSQNAEGISISRELAPQPALAATRRARRAVRDAHDPGVLDTVRASKKVARGLDRDC